MLKSKLNGRNLMKAINAYATSVVCYTAGIVKWTKEELEALDRMTRKQLTLYGALHPRSDVDRLCGQESRRERIGKCGRSSET